MFQIANCCLDNEKKKYFRIQANGTAPANSAYSSRDVKRRKLQDERSQAVDSEMARQKGRIRRSKTLETPLTGGILARECAKERGGLDRSQIVASRLVYQGYIPPISPYNSIFVINPRRDPRSSLVDLRISKANALSNPTGQLTVY
jgi:hypothetical protein